MKITMLFKLVNSIVIDFEYFNENIYKIREEI
jgi:hypothetical protein